MKAWMSATATACVSLSSGPVTADATRPRARADVVTLPLIVLTAVPGVLRPVTAFPERP
ncbi:hypothetical protein [Nonomuraea sp. bgisy101]|uniref:hypothetical protein n=1 Tax=Nonomuraea sp. bgisy101 TaxID=3413784 RepID=UPI003D713221